MHDNAPVHTVRIVQRLLQELGIEVMIWPPYLPDLNPIENLWAIMKQEIYKLYPDLEHAPDTADTLEWLIRAAKEAWDNINNQILERLSNTMPHRVKAVIEANGWYTKY
jgi:transposase